MTRYLIGAGGWAYFQVPGVHPLVAYSKAFDFVEVNSTFFNQGIIGGCFESSSIQDLFLNLLISLLALSSTRETPAHI